MSSLCYRDQDGGSCEFRFRRIISSRTSGSGEVIVLDLCFSIYFLCSASLTIKTNMLTVFVIKRTASISLDYLDCFLLRDLGKMKFIKWVFKTVFLRGSAVHCVSIGVESGISGEPELLCCSSQVK